MRKRRVLALLLALSLVVSGNGMTVLAAEQGADMPVLASQEEISETGDKSEEPGDASGNTEETSETDDKSEETGNPAEGDTSDEEGKTGEEETPENPETPVNPGENDPAAPKEDDTEQGADQPSTEDGEDGKQEEEPGVVKEEPAADVQEPTVSENDVDATEEPEEEPEEKIGEVRMMTFTDASGLRITFDANAAEANAEKVIIADGVLTAVDDSVEGVVDLRKESFTAIGEGAFQGKAKVEYVLLPKTVTSIGKNGFAGCGKLKGISIPSRLETIGESAFENCERMTQLAIPNSVTSIGKNAFKDNSRLFMVNMASVDYSKLTSIGNSAFEGCSALEFFCSDDDYELPNSLTTIGTNAFKGCTKIDEVNMGNGITTLGEGAYQNCSGIREVEISACIGTVSQYAFAGCTGLIEIEFNSMYNSVEIQTIEIAAYAFQGCSKLGSLELTQDVHIVRRNAFADCMVLRRVRIDDNRAILEAEAFPVDLRRDLCIVGLNANSAAARYAENGNHRFICFDGQDGQEKREYYTYTAKLSGTLVDTGQIKLKVTNNKDSLTTAFDSIKDINSITNSDATDKNYQNGVKAGTECYVVYTKPTGISLVSGSLTCNGKEIKRDSSGRYKFNMPVGGAAITAEFEADVAAGSTVPGTKDNIEGRLSSEADYDFERNIGSMDVGQSAKFYLINTYNGGMSRIPTSKITYGISPNSSSGVVSVSKDGTIKALKEGTGTVEASVNTDSGKATVSVTIKVGKTYINHIGIQVEDDTVDSKSEVRTEWVDKDEKGNTVGVSIPADKIGTGLEFDVEAEAFTTEDDANSLAVPFTWSSSDSKIARLEKTATKAGDSDNEIKIPAGANGEATITVSATGEDGKKVTRKFTVSVQSYEPRLTASKITVNPNQDEGATTIGVIDAYGRPIDDSKTIIAKDANGRKVDFIFKKVGEKEGLVTTYSVSALPGMVEKTYNVTLDIEVRVNSGTLTYQPSLTIVVKKSEPKPTVSFNKKDPKINLFLANDGVEIHPVIGKLGDHKVSGYSLEPLTAVGHKNYEDDKLFVENFQIDAQTGTITQKAQSLEKSNNGKGRPVLTGYLVLKFEGFGDLTKKYKITIPTQTVAPSYVLDKTSGTFGTGTPQPIELTLLDKKTKKPIAWDDAYHIDPGNKSTCLGVAPSLVKGTGVIDGVEQDVVKIRLTFQTGFSKGKLCMLLTNDKWAEGKSFTYTYNVKTDARPAQIKVKKSTVTLNTNYPKNKAEFELVSNHEDTEFAEEYEFAPLPNSANDKIIGKLTVECKDGKGVAFFGKKNTTDYSFVNDIPAGSYKYQAVYKDENEQDKKIALTIKIVRTTPAVTLKGTNALNLKAWTGSESEKTYVEVSEMTVTVKNLPDVEKWLEKPGESTGDGNEENPGTSGSGNEEGPGTPDNGDGNTENSGSGSGEGTGNSAGNDSNNNTETGEDNSGNSGTPDVQQTNADSTRTVSAGKINPEYYQFDGETTFKYEKGSDKSIQFTTKGCEEWNPWDYFNFEWIDGEKASEGKIRISLKKAMAAKTYTLKMTPTYKNGINPKPVQTAKPVSFKIKVYSGDIEVTLKAKGKINLLNRAAVEKNGIQYTPTFKNLKDTIKEVRLLDENDGKQAEYDQTDRISRQFTPIIAEDGKSFYIVPTDKADLENGKNYQLRIWIKTNGYEFPSNGGGTYVSKRVIVKTAEILPKVKTDKAAADLYMSSKAYETTFIVQKSDEKAIGAIESVAFGEKDEKANDSFEVWGVPQNDGSLEVHMRLKNGVSYGCNSTNKIKMYIQFTGQGTNTAGTPITMNVKINK